MRLWIPITAIFSGLVLLLVTSLSALGIPEVPVRDLLTAEHDGQEIKLQGVLKAIHKETRPIRFDVCDREDDSLVVQIEVDDVRPDVFEVGKDVAVIGIFSAESRTMAGTKIFTKCPSKYEESEKLQKTDKESWEALEAPTSPAGS